MTYQWNNRGTGKDSSEWVDITKSQPAPANFYYGELDEDSCTPGTLAVLNDGVSVEEGREIDRRLGIK